MLEPTTLELCKAPFASSSKPCAAPHLVHHIPRASPHRPLPVGRIGQSKPTPRDELREGRHGCLLRPYVEHSDRKLIAGAGGEVLYFPRVRVTRRLMERDGEAKPRDTSL